MMATSESQRAGTLKERLRGVGTTYFKDSFTWNEYGTCNTLSNHASADAFSGTLKGFGRLGLSEVALPRFSAII